MALGVGKRRLLLEAIRLPGLHVRYIHALTAIVEAFASVLTESVVENGLGLANGALSLVHFDTAAMRLLVFDLRTRGWHDQINLSHEVVCRVHLQILGVPEDFLLEVSADLVHQVLANPRVSQHHGVLHLGGFLRSHRLSMDWLWRGRRHGLIEGLLLGC